MNRKKQLLELISAKCQKLKTQDLKKVRDYIENIENNGHISIYTELCIERQYRYCKEHGYDCLIPDAGICPTCKKQIFEKITFIESEEKVITGCPYCDRSFSE